VTFSKKLPGPETGRPYCPLPIACLFGKKKRPLYRLASKQMAIPFVNNYDRNEYRKIMEDIGFYDVHAESIALQVYPASLEYFRQMGKGIKQEDVVIDIDPGKLSLEEWSCTRGWFMGFDDYILITARK